MCCDRRRVSLNIELSRLCFSLDVFASSLVLIPSSPVVVGVFQPAALGEVMSYLERIVECPAEIRVVGEGFLHAVYGAGDVGLDERENFDRHSLYFVTTISSTRMTASSQHRFRFPCTGSTGSVGGLRQRYDISMRMKKEWIERDNRHLSMIGSALNAQMIGGRKEGRKRRNKVYLICREARRRKG